MGFDLRLPIGGMFALFGAILALFGLFADRAIYEKSLGLNVNLGWGLFLLVFGLGMLAWAKARPDRSGPGDRSR